MAPQILVATDFSDEAEAALREGVDHARRVGAHLHILHVLSPGDVDVTRLLADAAALAGSDVRVTVASTSGDPAKEILRYARGHAVDRIVVGTHGRTGFSHALLGSVAERVLRGAACPVLVVPSRSRMRVTGLTVSPQGDAEERATPRRCLVCALPSLDLICEPCRARIRGEALEHKQREERAGRT